MGNEIGCMGSKKFQEPGLEERKNGWGHHKGTPQTQKCRYFLDMGSFWPLDKFLVRADS